MCPTMSEDTGANAENVCNVLTEFTIQSDTTPRLVRRFVRSRGAARSNSVDHSTCVLSMSSVSNSTCCPLQPMIRRASFQVNRCQQARRPIPAWFVPNKIVHVLMLSFPMSLAFTSVLTAHIVTGFRNTKSRASFSSLFTVSLPLLLRVPRLIVQHKAESPLDKAKSFLSLAVAGHEDFVDIARTRSAFLRHRVSSPIRVRVSRDVVLLFAQVVGFRCWDRQEEIQVSWSFQISQRLLGACQI